MALHRCRVVSLVRVEKAECAHRCTAWGRWGGESMWWFYSDASIVSEARSLPRVRMEEKVLEVSGGESV